MIAVCGLDTLEGREAQACAFAAPLVPERARQRAAVAGTRVSPWRKMPKRVRPYGSAEDAELAGLGHSQLRAGGEGANEPGSTMTMREIAGQAADSIRALGALASHGAGFAGLDDAREVIASLQRIGQDLPHLCEQLARILVVQREDGQIAPEAGPDPGFLVIEAVEALAAAGQAADMMTAALTEAGRTSGELRSVH